MVQGYIDEQGRLVLPPDIAARYGLRPGARVHIDERANALRLRQPVTHLARVYIEPTNACNLECRTCIRNVWDEPLGQMMGETFDRIVESLRRFEPCPSVFFGGYGEPLAHPNIIEMVARAKSLGAWVELITNGTLLTPDVSRGLIDAGLDALWVSLDGATPASYADVRLGAALPRVIENVLALREMRAAGRVPTPRIGIVFVAMRRNISDLPAVLRLGGQLGATRFLVSNVLPHTAEMRAEVLYSRVLTDVVNLSARWIPQVCLPKLDVDDATREPLYRVMRGGRSLSLAGISFSETSDYCPFIESGAMAIGCDGRVSPCLSLLRDHTSYLDERERFSRRYIVGNVSEQNLADVWNAPEYAAFRQRVQAFDFSPCTRCGGCDLSENNEEDCFGNIFPTCGGCLWAQGVIRCP